MIYFEETLKPVIEISAFTCDRCRRYVSKNDCFEFQEAHHISFVGGYGSVFGDGVKVECDLLLIGGISRITSNEN
jgi:hypothetical protein